MEYYTTFEFSAKNNQDILYLLLLLQSLIVFYSHQQ